MALSTYPLKTPDEPVVSGGGELSSARTIEVMAASAMAPMMVFIRVVFYRSVTRTLSEKRCQARLIP
jgi:hypothetical protein